MAEPVRAYLEQIGRYALLRPEQEVELARLVQRAQQLEQQTKLSPTEQRELRRGRRARERMIQANLRLVVTVAKTYQGRGLDLMDLVQEGSLGLIRAVEKFDPTLGYRFSTYAWNWIRQAISRGLETKGRTLRLPIHVTQQLRALHRAHERLWQQGLSTDLGAVAAEAGVDLKAASLALRMAPGTLSLDTPAAGSESDLLQLLPSAEPSPLDEAERRDRWERVGHAAQPFARTRSTGVAVALSHPRSPEVECCGRAVGLQPRACTPD